MNIRIAIASDLHVMAPELLIAPGAAFERTLRSDRKLLVESTEIIRQLTRQLLQQNIDLVLIPGDLTKDGERVSHQLTAQLLQPLLDAGIRTYVVPGNHDIYNPLAAEYDGDERRHTDYVSPEDFAQIYAAYGYGADATDIIERGPRLSYLAEPLPGLWVCALDSNIYDTNIQDNYPRTIGQLTPETHDWIREVGLRAKREGKRLLTMLHHGVLEHFPLQSVVAADYLLEDWLHDSRKLAAAGMEVVFTGHFHAQDVVCRRFKHGTLYDIETGSPVTYPCPYRIATLHDDRLEVTSHRIQLQGEVTGGLPLEEYAYRHLQEGIPGMGAFLTEYVLRRHPKYMTPQIAQTINAAIPDFVDLIMAIYTGHLCGDEMGLQYSKTREESFNDPLPGDKLDQLRNLAKAMYPQYELLFDIFENALYDTSVPDNNLTIPLTPLQS